MQGNASLSILTGYGQFPEAVRILFRRLRFKRLLSRNHLITMIGYQFKGFRPLRIIRVQCDRRFLQAQLVRLTVNLDIVSVLKRLALSPLAVANQQDKLARLVRGVGRYRHFKIDILIGLIRNHFRLREQERGRIRIHGHTTGKPFIPLNRLLCLLIKKLQTNGLFLTESDAESIRRPVQNIGRSRGLRRNRNLILFLQIPVSLKFERQIACQHRLARLILEQVIRLLGNRSCLRVNLEILRELLVILVIFVIALRQRLQTELRDNVVSQLPDHRLNLHPVLGKKQVDLLRLLVEAHRRRRLGFLDFDRERRLAFL